MIPGKKLRLCESESCDLLFSGTINIYIFSREPVMLSHGTFVNTGAINKITAQASAVNGRLQIFIGLSRFGISLAIPFATFNYCKQHLLLAYIMSVVSHGSIFDMIEFPNSIL